MFDQNTYYVSYYLFIYYYIYTARDYIIHCCQNNNYARISLKFVCHFESGGQYMSGHVKNMYFFFKLMIHS